ncbi:beige protein-like 1 [Emydomyces testavorans]|uniref:Beige protein-like 1 n=1 Tax=Emydomyces testavorans TaxID=2070801 RepID=A0AAF0DCH5_9EURO|nr:beige protein-like 1 [Emydomyces testavorans]
MSSLLLRPRRQSSPSSAERLTSKFRPTIDILAGCIRDSLSIDIALEATESILFLRHAFIDDNQPREAKDAFRQLQGFQVLLDLLQRLEDLYEPKSLDVQQRKAILALVKEIIGIFGEALKDHHGNKRYFAKRLHGNGNASFKQILSKLSAKLEDNSDADNGTEVEEFYGGLLAAGLAQQTVSGLFTSLRKKFEHEGTIIPAALKEAVRKALGSSETVENPEFFRLLLLLWLEQSPTPSSYPIQRQAIPACLEQLATQSSQNRLALHSSGILTFLLGLITCSGRNHDELDLYRELAIALSFEGFDNLEEAAELYRRAHYSLEAAKFLLATVKSSNGPPSVQFDMSCHGYSSIELPTLGKPFPPITSVGYTLIVWARFDNFDPNVHTTIFGAFDPTQTCFLLAYLEKDTRNLILQTSISGSRPSVRFKSTVFSPGLWYHICIVHKRPRPMSSSRALLFINGELVEQLKADYPQVPASRSGQKLPRVQAFLGTPQDLAVRIGKGLSTSRWSLASAVLLEEALADDIISVLCQLGPRYYGNFQDCLGSFQTYRASATLNLRNENLHPGKEEHSDIVAVIRQKASILIPENSILLNISPTAVLDNDNTNPTDELQLVKLLSKNAAKHLSHFTKAGGNSVVINRAVPAINSALTQPQGVAILTGHPVASIPQSLDDAAWRVGGCTAVHLSMVEAATTPEHLRLAVEILLESVQDSWRNSEAMEKENGYGILAVLLREKLGITTAVQTTPRKIAPVCSTSQDRNELAMELLILILRFVGYDFENPKKSIIINPLAYRVLLVDVDIWRLGDLPLLEIYYSQFRIFCIESYHHRFNARRLSRMRVIKKLLNSLKDEIYTDESLKLFTQAFSCITTCCMTAEILRSVSLFITYSIHKPKPSSRLQKKKSISSIARQSRRAIVYQFHEKPATYVSKEHIGAELLRVFTDIFCAPDSTVNIQKLARTVTNKWLLYLISEDEADVVILATKLLARLLTVHGASYTRKFDKSGGFVIMRHCLKRWWKVPALWLFCFAILFDKDVKITDIGQKFDDTVISSLFGPLEKLKVVHPEIFPVITGMLQSALKSSILKDRISEPSEDSDDELWLAGSNRSKNSDSISGYSLHYVSFSFDAYDLSISRLTVKLVLMYVLGTVESLHEDLLYKIVRFLADIHDKSSTFRDFTATSSYVESLLLVLFPVVVGSDAVSANDELNSRNSGLTFGSDSVVIQPLSDARPVLRTSTVERSGSEGGEHNLQRTSSFILVSSDKAKYNPSSARLRHIVEPKTGVAETMPTNTVVQELLKLITSVCADQLLTRKEFPGLSIFVKTPPGFIEHQIYFESWLQRNTLLQMGKLFSANRELLLEPRALTNLARLLSQVSDAIYEGWFIDGATATLDFAGPILEYLQKSEIASLKSVRLCSQTIATIRSILFRTMLLKLSETEDAAALAFLKYLAYWQTVLLGSEETQAEHLQLMCYLLYSKIVTEEENVRLEAASWWRIILVQKPTETLAMLSQTSSSLYRRLSAGFQELVAMDDSSFLRWIDDQRDDLDCFFFGTLSKVWENFVKQENNRTDETARNRLSKRKEKLKQWSQADSMNEEIIRRHDVTFGHWTSNISLSEKLKHQRFAQDQQDDFTFLLSSFSRIYRNLRCENGLLAEGNETKWRLDQTEGRSRMRQRIIPDDTVGKQDYQPKRRATGDLSKPDIRQRSNSESDMVSVTPTDITAEVMDEEELESESDDKSGLDDSFEIIEEPKDIDENYEDKNRKVMRSLHRGDQVQHVCNISRIVGLEACEGLLILGKDSIYIMDNYFQRPDGEIVNVWQAAGEERDSYVRMISGRESNERRYNNGEHETRSWKWSDVVSVSKRRFLFRDVALEIFFMDGRSFLITLVSSFARNELHTQLISRAPQTQGASNHSQPDDTWRFEALRNQESKPQFFGSKLVNAFSQGSVHPATRKWLNGEMSNFHYLMLVNTLAGRTFNDLTQYPVFPWILADYTSEELDLTNPKTFRDLSKPMGCQTSEREVEFKSRYQCFAEMGDHNAPPFHYGTHYSSAMIVCSYLIRLQPFVKSYLLLQGGTFDHADRLFYSVAKAWNSASTVNMTDVRELTPEFFYLPEFLVNSNKYDFGLRQNMSQAIDSVELPPWAKGDPKIFIAKHREALESPFVSRNLHRWIDLIFGYKQKGEAAVEAVNVFHHLSYQGAKDLDNIEDPLERLATIGIIHNFGQTPHQVFNKPHPQREEVHHKLDQLDIAAEGLTRLPLTLLDTQERVASLSFSVKHDRLLCSAAFRLNIPPNYDKYMEWGFSDNSIRFFATDSRKPVGHFEHLHIGRLSCALFADSQTLVTSGVDCTISVWSYTATAKSVDLHPKATLFGHRTPVTTLAVSRSFSVILSASTDGKLMLWDLNRLEFVRELPAGEPVEVSFIRRHSVPLVPLPNRYKYARINDATGNIVVCRCNRVSLYTLNGALLLEQVVCDQNEDIVLSCAFYEGVSNEWLERELIFTGHRRGLVNIWSKTIRNGQFELDLIRQLHHVDQAREDRPAIPAGITCILPLAQAVYTGDEAGRVVRILR